MKKIRIGVLGPADIAIRKMIPAFMKCDDVEFIGIAVASEEERTLICDIDIQNKNEITNKSKAKANEIIKKFGGKIYFGYETLLQSKDIDAIYIALPPKLHYFWGKKALENNLHVFMEKPFATSLKETEELVCIAKEKKLAITENFAFIYHPQIQKIQEIIDKKQIGEIKLIRSNFGFPFRGSNDFRYKKELGGGSLLDCGCYTIKMAQLLLGNIKIESSLLFAQPDYEVDIYGTITATNDKNEIAQLSFSMNQQYKCELEIIGTKGYVKTDRIYTAPDDYTVEIIITKGLETQTIEVPPANQFLLSILNFKEMIMTDKKSNAYIDILNQSEYIEQCIVGELK